MNEKSYISKPLMPDDVERGDFVSILNWTIEMLPIVDLSEWSDIIEPKRAVVLPCETAVYRVIDVCVPFVLAKKPDGAHVTFDLRRYRLARVSKQFGRRVFKRLKPKVESVAVVKSLAELTE